MLEKYKQVHLDCVATEFHRKSITVIHKFIHITNSLHYCL